MHVNTGTAIVSNPIIDIHNGLAGNQYGIHINSSVTLNLVGGSIEVDDEINAKYGLYHNIGGDALLDGMRITISGSAGSQYAIYSNTSSSRNRIRNSILDGSSAAVRASTSTSSLANHTYISDTILLGNGVFGGELFLRLA